MLPVTLSAPPLETHEWKRKTRNHREANNNGNFAEAFVGQVELKGDRRNISHRSTPSRGCCLRRK
jgi:hypothetical protein